MKVKNIESIYPLTIVSNRYNSKIIIFNSHNERKARCGVVGMMDMKTQ